VTKDNRFTIFRADGYAINLMMFNLEFEPFAKKEVRQAFAHAIDRKAVIDATSPLTQTTADNLLPSWMSVYTDDVPKYGYDPARSRALLRDAGYPDGFSFKRTNTAAGGGVAESDLLQQDFLAKVSIKMDFELVETTVYNQRRNNGDFQQAGRLLPAVNPDTILFGYLHPMNIAPKGLNSARYNNPTVASLLEQARGELAADRRNQLYAEAQRLALADLPYLPMAQSSTAWPAWTAVKGVAINKLADVDFWSVTMEAS
jgi:peptide/nickel transport system substrate-binding protein